MGEMGGMTHKNYLQSSLSIINHPIPY